MRLPRRPPSFSDVMSTLASDPDRFLDVFRSAQMVDSQGRYLHWDDFRFREPPPGLSKEEAWVATRMARDAASYKIPLLDISAQPFRFAEPPLLKAILRDLDMNAGGALAADRGGLSAGDGRRHLTRSLAEEPFASSMIEGAATTRQIAKKLIFEGREPRTRDELMVLNNYRALEFVKSRRADPLSMDMLLELHRLITEGTLDDPKDAGRIRTSDDIQVVDDSTNEILHQPPPAIALPERLALFIDFANRKEEAAGWVHPLLKAFILHFMLAYEHPFADGNGRVARALFYWSALRNDYWLIEYVSISSVIAESKIAYGKSFLFVESDSADLTYFLIYHAEILQTAIRRLEEYVARRRAELAAFDTKLAERRRGEGLNHRQSWLLNEMARTRLSRITIQEHAVQHRVSYLTARADLEALAAERLLRKTKKGRTSIYSPARNLVGRMTSTQ